MAYLSDWKEGTITVTNGSAVVTGVGTVWNGAGLQEGDEIIANNLIGIILTRDSATQVTLTAPWQGATAAGISYRARYQADGSRYTAVAKQVLQEIQSGNLSAISGLVGTANSLPMFTGPGAMSLLATGTTGRAVLGADNQDAAAVAGGFVRRSGGVNMADHNVYFGWAAADNGFLTQVNGVPQGYAWTDSYVANNPAARRTALGAYSSSGGNITGSVNASGNLGTAASLISGNGLVYSISGANQDGAYYLQTGTYLGSTFNRWALVKRGFGTGEPGGNVGGDFAIMRWADDNSFLGTPITISRKSGAVSLRDTPLCAAYPGTGTQTLGVGQFIGPLNAAGTFNFNRGSFYAGGNPGAGGRVVHIGVTGWYSLTLTVTCSGAGTVILALNGGGWASAYNFSNQWMTLTTKVLAFLNVNDNISLSVGFGPMQISLENTSLRCEWVQE